MPVKYGKMVLFKCSRCNQSLKKFHIKNAFLTLGNSNIKYFCPHCNRRHGEGGFFILLTFTAIAFFYTLFYQKFIDRFVIGLGGDEFIYIRLFFIICVYFYFLGAFRPLAAYHYEAD